MLFIAAIVAILIIVIVIASRQSTRTDTASASAQRLAGRQGEKFASEMIKSVLREGDHYFTNVTISFDNRPTELDNVIVNPYGVFIIEVKNYEGYLVGSADDYEWKKIRTTPAGNTYVKVVKNPIKQVRRQIYLLAHYLDAYGTRVWVEGYALLLHENSPVESAYILSNVQDIDKAIHTPGRNRRSQSAMDSIIHLLSQAGNQDQSAVGIQIPF